MRTDKSFDGGQLEADSGLRKEERVVARASHLFRVFSHLRSSNEPVVSAEGSSFSSCCPTSNSTRRPKKWSSYVAFAWVARYLGDGRIFRYKKNDVSYVTIHNPQPTTKHTTAKPATTHVRVSYVPKAVARTTQLRNERVAYHSQLANISDNRFGDRER